MVEFQNKNDYSVIVFSNSGFLCKYTFVGNIYKLSIFLDNHQQFKSWEKINIYARRSGRFLKQIRKGDFIEPKPK